MHATRDERIDQRLDRLEHIAVMLASEVSRGQGSLGNPFWDFIDTINAERGRVLHHEPLGPEHTPTCACFKCIEAYGPPEDR